MRSPSPVSASLSRGHAPGALGAATEGKGRPGGRAADVDLPLPPQPSEKSRTRLRAAAEATALDLWSVINAPLAARLPGLIVPPRPAVLP